LREITDDLLARDVIQTSVGAVNELPVEKKLEFLQFSDSEIKTISRRLELEDDERFSLVDSLVYRKVDNSLKFVISESMICNVLRIIWLVVELRKLSRRD